MKKQQTFIFKKFVTKTYSADFMPTSFIDIESLVAAQILKSGYVYRDLKKEHTVTITAAVARANVPLKERKELQQQIDKMPGEIRKVIKPK